MKKLVLFLSLSFLYACQGSRGAGLILETDPEYLSEEISKVEVFRTQLSSRSNGSVFKKQFIGANGKQLSIDIRFISRIVLFYDAEEYSNIVDESSLDPLISKQAELEDVAAKVPQARPYLRSNLIAVKEDIRRFHSGERKRNGKWLTSAEWEKSRIVIDSVQYDNVELWNVNDTYIAFRYSLGRIAHVDIAKLTTDQINFLNGTSSKLHIDANWREKAEQAARQRAAEEQSRLSRLARENVEKKRSALAAGHNMEDAARYDEALELYKRAEAEDEMYRLSEKLAIESERKGDFIAAVEYFEAAGKFGEAGRIRRTRDLTKSQSIDRLTDAQIFTRAVPAVVEVAVRSAEKEAHGSGFFVHSGGYVITNNHVVEGMTQIAIVDANGQRYPARIIARTSSPDLALLKAELPGHKVLRIGDSRKTHPGDHVVAIGFPILENQSAIMNQGIISSVDRTFSGNSVFQIDATINHGNSGGPLLNDHGEVIGVTTFGLAEVGLDRFNFAIKISEAHSLIERIRPEWR